MGKNTRNKYQATLNLPGGDFPMRAALPTREPARLEAWYARDLYGAIRAARAGRPEFILHDGPPYANGRIHTGTAMNKILKDIVVKYKTMRGFDVPFVPGWDCHGLPVEHALFRELGQTKHDVDQCEFRRQARAYAEKYIDLQRTQFKRLGVLGEWDAPYITMDYQYEADIIRAFGELYEQGYIYKGLKPIHWCATCETALAEAEVEYQDHASPSIYVKFPVVSGQKLPFGDVPDPAVVIWTTTPWTLPADRAVAVKPDITYCAVPHAGGTLIMAVDLAPEFCGKLGSSVPAMDETCPGSALEGLQLHHPIDDDRTVPVILGDYVTVDTGTGCVHTAPGHGQEDYQAGLAYGLEIASPVDDKGCFTHEVPRYEGVRVFDANKGIIEDLRARGILLHAESIEHAYPQCWRCHQPVIFRATEQWFVGVDRHDMRRKALEAVANVTWVPGAGCQRITSMLELRPDWCLSRQRLWGTPIPVIYCTECGKDIIDPRTIDYLVERVAQEGADIWFALPPEELLPPGTACGRCGAHEFRKETDILDVWFDAGVSSRAVLERRDNLHVPADLYLEGSDQHRGWFQLSLLVALGLRDAAPFKTVVTHGWTLTETGEKESKSKGNFTDPEWVYSELGADILRLWVGSVNFMQDVMISPNLLRQVGDAYRRIRNTFKFLLGNLVGFAPGQDDVPADRLQPLDRYILHRLEAVREQVTRAYERYEFYRAFHLLHNFCTVELSALYCDIVKDRLYVEQTEGAKRRACQTALYEILDTLVRLLAPIMAFTCDEVWDHVRALAGVGDETWSVHLADWPAARPERLDATLAGEFAALLAVRTDVLRELETKRQEGLIGAGLEAAVALACDDAAISGVLEKYAAELPALFIVSQVRLDGNAGPDWVSGQEIPALKLAVRKAEGTKCARCWNFSASVGTICGHNDLCARCHDVLSAAGAL